MACPRLIHRKPTMDRRTCIMIVQSRWSSEDQKFQALYDLWVSGCIMHAFDMSSHGWVSVELNSKAWLLAEDRPSIWWPRFFKTLFSGP